MITYDEMVLDAVKSEITFSRICSIFDDPHAFAPKGDITKAQFISDVKAVKKVIKDNDIDIDDIPSLEIRYVTTMEAVSQ